MSVIPVLASLAYTPFRVLRFAGAVREFAPATLLPDAIF
jgi:hypothetical protein